MDDQQVVVIGAGAAGLATAVALQRAGVKPLVLERADGVGASWRGRYDRLRLNTSRWTSKLPRTPYARGTGIYPSRDEMVSYLGGYADRHRVDVRVGTPVNRVDREDGRWIVQTPSGAITADQVVVATGHEHTPVIPDWPGRERFGGRLFHAAEYRNAEPFEQQDVLVVGPGCSGVEIAYDIATNGARRVRLAVRTPPNIFIRAPRGLANDLPPKLLVNLPPRLADVPARLVRRLEVGNLDEYGLPRPDEGPMTRLRREGKAPAIIDKEMLEAIKDRRIEIVAGLESFDESGVRLADGERIEPDAVIAATGYSCGLAPILGHLGVLDDRGVPVVSGAKAATPGLRFVGYVPRPGQIGYMGGEGKRAAKAIARELTRSGRQLGAARA